MNLNVTSLDIVIGSIITTPRVSLSLERQTVYFKDLRWNVHFQRWTVHRIPNRVEDCTTQNEQLKKCAIRALNSVPPRLTGAKSSARTLRRLPVDETV